jgi:hypothetical protein
MGMHHGRFFKLFRKTIVTFGASLAFVFSSSAAEAAIRLELTNGDLVQGELVEKTGESITLKLATGEVRTIPRNSVVKMTDLDKPQGKKESEPTEANAQPDQQKVPSNAQVPLRAQSESDAVSTDKNKDDEPLMPLVTIESDDPKTIVDRVIAKGNTGVYLPNVSISMSMYQGRVVCSKMPCTLQPVAGAEYRVRGSSITEKDFRFRGTERMAKINTGSFPLLILGITGATLFTMGAIGAPFLFLAPEEFHPGAAVLTASSVLLAIGSYILIGTNVTSVRDEKGDSLGAKARPVRNTHFALTPGGVRF